MTKMVRCEGIQDEDHGEIQELIGTTLEKLTKDDLMETHASKPVPNDKEEDVEEAESENQLTLDNLAEEFQLFSAVFYFFFFFFLMKK